MSLAPLSNPKHELFAIALAKGLSCAKSYIAAGYRPDPKGSVSGKLRKRTGVVARVASLRELMTTEECMSVADKRALLRRIANHPSERTADRLKAMELDSRIAGHLAPTKTEGLNVRVNSDGLPANTSELSMRLLAARQVREAKNVISETVLEAEVVESE